MTTTPTTTDLMDVLDDLAVELDARANYPEEGEMLMPMWRARRLLGVLQWAGDEIVQTTEDLHTTLVAQTNYLSETSIPQRELPQEAGS